MIIDRITAIRVIEPRIVTSLVPVGRVSGEVERVVVVGTGERHVADGALGTLLDVSYEELEVDVYAPRDVLVFAERSQVRPA